MEEAEKEKILTAETAAEDPGVEPEDGSESTGVPENLKTAQEAPLTRSQENPDGENGDDTAGESDSHAGEPSCCGQADRGGEEEDADPLEKEKGNGGCTGQTQHASDSRHNEDIRHNEDMRHIEDMLASLTDSVGALSKEQERMNQLFVQKIQHTAHEEQIVDQMHEELVRYREDLYAQLVRPVLMDLISVRDSLMKTADHYESGPEEERLVPLNTFKSYAYDLQDILEKNNIVIYQSAQGEDFVPVRHRAIRKVITSQEELHGKIAESMSSGYEYMGRTLSSEKVAVYVYQPTAGEGEEENKHG